MCLELSEMQTTWAHKMLLKMYISFGIIKTSVIMQGSNYSVLLQNLKSLMPWLSAMPQVLDSYLPEH